MKYLGIDTASETIAVVLRSDDKTYCREINEQKTASEVLLVAIDELLTEAGLKLADLDFFACAIGPGSFTGIRIGVVTVKTFAYTLNKPVVAVNTLEKLAYNNKEASVESIISVVHAYADFCYIAAYSPSGDVLLEAKSMTYAEAEKLIAEVDEPRALFGDAYSAVRLGLTSDCAIQSFIGAIESAFNAGKTLMYGEVEPFYLLKSQAERDRGE